MIAPEPWGQRAEEQKVGVRMFLSEQVPDISTIQVAVVMYSGKFIKERPKVARDFLAAYVKGVRYYLERGPKNDEIARIVSSHTGVPAETIKAATPLLHRSRRQAARAGHRESPGVVPQDGLGEGDGAHGARGRSLVPPVEGRVLVELRDIGKTWSIARTRESTVALQSITLDVTPGEFLILLGPSGCGKSTLLQIMAGLEKPSRGAIRFPEGNGGQKLTSMVFQEYALFPWRTVAKNVAFGPEVRGVPRAQREATAQRLIDLVNLRGFENRYPHELSGGMRQRVALARALANDPADPPLRRAAGRPRRPDAPRAPGRARAHLGADRARRSSTSPTASRRPCSSARASCS